MPLQKVRKCGEVPEMQHICFSPETRGGRAFCSNFISNYPNLFGESTECRKLSEDSLQKSLENIFQFWKKLF